MKRYLYFTFLLVISITNRGLTQPSEKFLKLNRIISIDSSKTITGINTPNARTAYSFIRVTVPPGVYWKIDNVSFLSNPLLYLSDAHDFRIKINNTFLTMMNSENPGLAQTSINYYFDKRGFNKTTAFWVGPNTVISAVIIGIFGDATLSADFFLSAQEFFLE